MATNIDEIRYELTLNERQEVVLLVDGDSVNLGPKDAACQEMSRFLAEVGSGDGATAVQSTDSGSDRPKEIDEVNFELDPDLSSGL